MALILVDAEDVATGKVVECLIDNSIKFGEEFTEDGRTLRRIPTVPQGIVKDQEFQAWDMPFRDEVQAKGLTPAEHYTQDGVAAFSTAKGRREYAKKFNDDPSNGRQIAWDR